MLGNLLKQVAVSANKLKLMFERFLLLGYISNLYLPIVIIKLQ